ncbi:hypothetical protein KKI17_00740, partial [Patescibacteria group bacterium]|nr:hypothetical protein [Patescibacteria group bacterium]
MLRVQIRWKIFSIALLVLMAHFGFVGFSQAALESLGVPVPGEAVPSTNMWAAGNLLYGESNGPFFVYNTVTQKVIYSGNADINNVQRNIMVDNDGNAYFGVNTNRLAKYSPVTNTVRVLSHILPNFLRASTRESSSGWIYGATGQNAPTDIFRYNPKQDIFQTLGSSWGYTAHMVLDPNERYVYYIPDAHGASYLKGTPVLQYDVVARTHKVIAFLDNVYRPKGYYLGGSYAFDMDEKGNLYINMNADKVGFDGNLDGFGVPVMVVVHIPDSERCVAVACPKTPWAQFRDVASEVDIDGSPGLPLYNSYIHTSSWGDVDNDGWI